MNNKFIYLILVILTLLFSTSYSQVDTYSATNQGQIQQLANMIVSGGSILLPNLEIRINTPILITNSNIKLIGDTNTLLKLDDNSNCPIIVVGVQGTECITNIQLILLQIDGNRTNQQREIWKLSNIGYPIYNNGIVIQNSRDVLVYDVIISDCRSGGFVSTFGVSKLNVINYVAFNNQFDGLACYQTTESIFVNLLLHDNIAAGISLDMEFNNNIFDNIILTRNDIGIFMRNSAGNIFRNVNLHDNKSFDLFISSINNLPMTGCNSNYFDIRYDGKLFKGDNLCTNNVFRYKL